MRIFSGFLVSNEFQDEFINFQASQKPLSKLRWTKLEQLHMTVWFYGEIAPEMLPNIIAVNKVLTRDIKAFNLKLSKIKLAPRNQNARMIWAKYQKNTEFDLLVKYHQESLKAIGLSEKDFIITRPHVTLARFPEGSYSNKNFDLRSINFPPTLIASELVLWESIKTEHGNQYKVIHSVTL